MTKAKNPLPFGCKVTRAQDGDWQVVNQAGTHWWNSDGRWSDTLLEYGRFPTRAEARKDFEETFVGKKAKAPPGYVAPKTVRNPRPALRKAPEGTKPKCYNGKWILENVSGTHFYNPACGWTTWGTSRNGCGWADTRDEVIQDYLDTDGATLPVPTDKDSQKSTPVPTPNRVRSIRERAVELKAALEASGKYGIREASPAEDTHSKVLGILEEHMTDLWIADKV